MTAEQRARAYAAIDNSLAALVDSYAATREGISRYLELHAQNMALLEELLREWREIRRREPPA